MTYDDAPTIRHALLKRLDHERGVRICDIVVRPGPDCVCVGLLALLDNTLRVTSRFDLPGEFELRHLHNEIDEIAEQLKAVRADYWREGRPGRLPEREVAGSGVRGRWAQHDG